ncbi:hypothetical protein GCM10023184_35360 [Flaviaesturariibacter amylovorans]|uniref:Uncharacterized protein n=1 Tax=Flaviaesturariibacter amylovorans TaxID=1084520 RepID=A0ABP8HFX2_9BACT
MVNALAGLGVASGIIPFANDACIPEGCIAAGLPVPPAAKPLVQTPGCICTLLMVPAGKEASAEKAVQETNTLMRHSLRRRAAA